MPIYFARQGLTGNIKIGFANDPAARMKQLQAGQPIKLRIMRLVDGTISDEKMLHRRFASLAIGGEWFQFHRDMLGNVGLPALPKQQFGKYAGDPPNWPDRAWEFELQLHIEITGIIGGTDELARRCNTAPWLVTDGYRQIRREFWSATVLLLRERGRNDIPMSVFELAQRNSEVERATETAKKRRDDLVAQEAQWIKRHPGVKPWWDICEENRSLLDPPSLAIVPPAPASAA